MFSVISRFNKLRIYKFLSSFKNTKVKSEAATKFLPENIYKECITCFYTFGKMGIVFFMTHQCISYI